MRRTVRKIADYFTVGTLVLLVALAAAMFSRLGEHEYGGPFKVMDGDSLVSGEQRFRLEGIDAPEYRQMCNRDGAEWACGKQAGAYLRELIRSPGVICRGLGVDKYDRILAKCRLGETDINGEMVEQGWAVSFGEYQGEERRARNAGRGIWAGQFVRPQEWRRLHADAGETGTTGIVDGIVARLRLWWQGVWKAGE